MDELKGRGAVVVGGGSGIGRGIALSLAAEGMQVLIADIDIENAGAVREEIGSHGGEAFAARVDATDRDSLAQLAARAAEDLGRVHLLVNTVGIHANAPVDSGEDVWAWFVEFHLMTAVRVVQAFVPLLRAHDDGGHIVLTSSMAGLVAFSAEETNGVNTGVYTTLKYAVVGYGDMLRHDLASEGIGVSVLCPGGVETSLASTSAKHRPERFGGPMPDPMAGRELPPEVREKLGIIPLETVGPIVVRGVRANRSYILTHPEMVDAVRGRQEQLLADFAFFAAK